MSKPIIFALILSFTLMFNLAEAKVAYSKSGSENVSECPKDRYCTKSEYGVIYAMECPGSDFQCSGIDWKSEFKDSIPFTVVSPDGDPPREWVEGLSIYGAGKESHIDLTQKTIACGGQSGWQKSQLKKEGKYWRFRLDTKCGSETHSVDAICQELVRVCVRAVPKK
jgi:hypothetical protein